MGARLLCLGSIVAPHGVRGLVKVKSWTEDPMDLVAYGPLWTKDRSRELRLTVTGRAKNLLLAEVEGVTDRDAAEALKGLDLYIERAALPDPEEEEFYHNDLIGLKVFDRQGQQLGIVKAVQNFGAGDFLEVVKDREEDLLLPFTKAAVPEINLVEGHLIACPPDEAGEKVPDQ